jgi:hypothetical protein
VTGAASQARNVSSSPRANREKWAQYDAMGRQLTSTAPRTVQANSCSVEPSLLQLRIA